MRLVCPNNYEHKRFSVIAHVTQEWGIRRWNVSITLD